MHPPLSFLFPFGAPLRPVVQTDRTRKKVFVLGAYASAVHAKWIGPDERVLSFALAVASEPTIFWDGTGADAIVAELAIPAGAGRLVPADAQLNGPSGRSLDEEYLSPLGLTRSDVWLCDLVPHACMNEGQKAAIDRAYEPRRTALGLPRVTLPRVPSPLADEKRREEIDAELAEARPEVLVLLGDEPMKHYLKPRDARWRSLAAFGHGDDYGRLHEATVAGVRLSVLPLVHPRQASGLGKHSQSWRQNARGVEGATNARGFMKRRSARLPERRGPEKRSRARKFRPCRRTRSLTNTLRPCSLARDGRRANIIPVGGKHFFLQVEEPAMSKTFTVAEASALLNLDEKEVRKQVELGIFTPRTPVELSFSEAVFLFASRRMGVHLSGVEDRRRVLVVIERALETHPRQSRPPLGEALEVNVGAMADQVSDRVARFRAWLKERVSTDSRILAGDPIFKGTRLSVRKIGETINRHGAKAIKEIREDYPSLTEADFEFAGRYVRAYPRRGRPREAAP